MDQCDSGPGPRTSATYQYEAYAGFHALTLHTDSAPLLLFADSTALPQCSPWQLCEAGNLGSMESNVMAGLAPCRSYPSCPGETMMVRDLDLVSPTMMPPRQSSVSSVGEPSGRNRPLRKPVLGCATMQQFPCRVGNGFHSQSPCKIFLDV